MHIPDPDFQQMLAILKRFKETNPKFHAGGETHDPYGAHGLVEKYGNWKPPVPVELHDWERAVGTGL